MAEAGAAHPLWRNSTFGSSQFREIYPGHALPGTAGEGAVTQSGFSSPKAVDMRRSEHVWFILVFATSGEAAHAAALDLCMEEYRSSSLVLGRTHATLMKAQRPAALF
eukprot:scaffold12354_cov54-Phaeocystis_antarctica.AAC.1